MPDTTTEVNSSTTATPAATASQAKPGKLGKKKLAVIAGVVGVILLIVVGIVVYQFWYLPKSVRDFVAASETQLTEIYSKADASQAQLTSLYSPDNKVPLTESEDTIASSNNSVKEFNTSLQALVASLPPTSPATAELKQTIDEYVAASAEFSTTFAEYNDYILSYMPSLEKMLTALSPDNLNPSIKTLNDIDAAVAKFKAAATEIRTLKDSLPAISNPEKYPSLVKYNEGNGAFLDALAKFLDVASEALVEMKAAGLASSVSGINAATAKITAANTELQAAVVAYESVATTSISISSESEIGQAYNKSKAAYDKMMAKFAEVKSAYGI